MNSVQIEAFAIPQLTRTANLPRQKKGDFIMYQAKNTPDIKLSAVAAALSIAFAATATAPAHAAAALKAYNADPSTLTVSGISSGAYFAVQMQVAFSSKVKGAAIFAGGPYYCAQGSVYNGTGYCMSGSGIPLSTLYNYTDNQANAGNIDPTSNLANQKVYMFSGTSDTTVHQAVMDSLKTYYLHYNVGTINYNNNTPAAHAWISPDGPNACSTFGSPYVNNCNIDPEQTFLSMFYGSLNAKNTGTLGGSYVTFDQSAFIGSGKGMDSTGQLYVPANCANGQVCKIHVSFHGCLQAQQSVQQQFVQKSGINEWADTNNIIVLYPQAVSSYSPLNPNGCWDWWGIDDTTYATKNGTEMKAVMAMINKITSGYSGGGTTTTTAGGTTTTTTATTTTTTAAGTCYNSSNYTHTTAGRAYVLYGVTYANGSNQNMGLWNIYTNTKLRKTGTNYYAIDNTCP
jgi:poly(3-hydroxybutyrate) depolymerase